MRFGIFTNCGVNCESTRRDEMKLKFNDLHLSQAPLYSPLKEVVTSSVCMDGGESLKAAGDVRGEW